MKKKLKDICTQVRGVSYKPSDLRDENSGVPILRANNIQDTGIVLDELVYVDSSKVHSEQYLLTDDIVICASSGSKNLVGKAATFKSDLSASFGAFCKVVRINNSDDLCKAYIQQYFQSKIYRNAISESSAGANINNIKTEDIEALEIPLPSKEEQIKIAAELDTIQSAIDNKKQQLALLDEAVKSEFVEMFGNKNFPTQKWDSVFITKTGKLDSNAMVEGGKYPFFTCAKEIFSIDNYAFAQEALLLAGNNAAGKYDVKYYKGKFNAYQRTYVLSLKKAWSYRLFQFQLEDKLLYLKEQSKGINTKFLTLKILQELEFIIPPKELQLKFETFVQQIDKSKFVVKQQIADLQELLDSKMQEYFS